MWPLSRHDVMQACGINVNTAALSNYLVHGAVIDSRKVKEGYLFVAIKGENFDGHDYISTALSSGACLALADKNWLGFTTLTKMQQEKCILVENVTASFRKLAAYMRSRFSFPVIGIGGSNGKTTTKEMLAAILDKSQFSVSKTEKSENGFLGMALTLTSPAHNIAHAPHALVLEIGIDEIGAMSEHVQLGRPDMVILTALGPEHLQGLKSWEIGIQEELKLFNLSNNSCKVWNMGDPIFHQYKNLVTANDIVVLPNTENLETFLQNKVYVLTYSPPLKNSTEQILEFSFKVPLANDKCLVNWNLNLHLNLPGEHNATNLALAVAAAAMLGRTSTEIQTGFSDFIPPQMRSRIHTLPNGCVLYDDCYNASPASMNASLTVLLREEWEAKQKMVVLGDMLDLGEESAKWHANLIPLLSQIKNAHLCFFGKAMQQVFTSMQKSKNSNNVHLYHLNTDINPINFLEQINIPLNNSVVLIKGSRGMDLGRVVVHIEQLCK